MEIKEFAESANGFTKNPLGIIALFIVLIYGFASLVVSVGLELTSHTTPLVYFLVIFPVIVFIGFLWLVSQHPDKIYGPSDYKNEDNYIKLQMTTVASLAAATAKQQNKKGSELSEIKREELFNNEIDYIGELDIKLDEIVNMVSETTKKDAVQEWKHKALWRNKILWVDDQPRNNIHERRAFDAQGFSFRLVESTDEAIENLKIHKYIAIISDMGRREGPQEGYVLLEKIRNSGDTTPFFIYAGSNAPEHKHMARKRGAQGSTNRSSELYSLVMEARANAS